MQAPSSFPRLLRASPHAFERLPLHGVRTTRQWEETAVNALPPHTLMQRAGLAIARVALAVAPHAQCIWIACGPGNNGGDGLQAATWLQQWGKQVKISTLAPQTAMPADAQAAWQSAMEAGVCWVDEPPALQAEDLCIDALLGIGASRPPDAAMQRHIAAMRNSPAPILAVDIPSGLLADTGAWAGNAPGVAADHTLSLLTLKPGLFTAQGRDAAGQVWWHDLDASTDAPEIDTPEAPAADAWLQGIVASAFPKPQHDVKRPRFAPDASLDSGANRFTFTAPAPCSPQTHAHASHKGCFGDVCIIGGDAGMQGAAILAGEAALYAGAGRVYVGLLQASTSVTHDAGLMLRPLPTLSLPADDESVPATGSDLNPALDSALAAALPCRQASTVCGCGGGQAIARWLPAVLQQAPRLLLDADALNAIAAAPALQTLLRQRAAQGACTLLTPHPLEAARLLHSSAAAVQRNRLQAAQELANAFQCIVVLKGSGSICALASKLLPENETANTAAPVINHSGNALLATAGTGDVLAGCVGAYWAQAQAQMSPATPADAWLAAWRACCTAVHAHGRVADVWNACTMRGSIHGAFDGIWPPQPLSAQGLARHLCRPGPANWQPPMLCP
ncbi:MAG: NAD(P)H-hydrate epimerase [Brachymonas sp.]|nr:NAD(P)H-hydrate epimerase [Brachymonas sp.]